MWRRYTSLHIYIAISVPLVITNTTSRNIAWHISLYIQNQDTETVSTYKHPCVKILRLRAVVLLARLESPTVDEDSNAGMKSRYMYIHSPISPILSLSLSYLPSLPPSSRSLALFPPLSFSFPPSLAASRRVYEGPRQRRHHGLCSHG